MRPVLALLAVTAAVAATVGVSVAGAQADPARSYYVDSANGNDSASGRDSSHAWRTLKPVNATTFQPGDQILLRSGGTWTGQQLAPRGSGTLSAPIVVDRYGSGAKPRLNGAGAVADTVRLFNQEYWTLRNVEVTNAVANTGTPGRNLRDLRGIHVSGDSGTTLHGFVIDAVNVHDVTGVVNWIGGSASNNATGVRFATGWDGSKHTGGIVFDTTVPNVKAPPATATVLDGITVNNSTITNTSFGGIVVKQYAGDGKDSSGKTIAEATGWGTRKSASDTRFTPHTHVVIRDNVLSQKGTAYGCNAIYLTDVRGATVESNLVRNAGTSGIETYYADDVTIQFNEVSGTTRKAGGQISTGSTPTRRPPSNSFSTTTCTTMETVSCCASSRSVTRYSGTTSSPEVPGTPLTCTPTERPRHSCTTTPCTATRARTRSTATAVHSPRHTR